LKDENALRRGGDFWNLIDFPLDDQRARHPAADLDGGRSVQMRVVPVRARRVIRADAVFVLPHLSRLDAESRVVHDEVAVDTGCYQARRNVQSMRMKIRAVGIAQMLYRFAAAGIGGQLIDDL